MTSCNIKGVWLYHIFMLFFLLLCNGGHRQNTFSVNDIICIFLSMRTHAHKCKSRFFLYALSFVYIITSCPWRLIGQDFYTVMVILPSVAAMVCSSQPLTLCFNMFVWVEIFFKTMLERIGFKEKKESWKTPPQKNNINDNNNIKVYNVIQVECRVELKPLLNKQWLNITNFYEDIHCTSFGYMYLIFWKQIVEQKDITVWVTVESFESWHAGE